MESMGGRQLVKSVGTLVHIKQRSDESLGDFYNRFNKELPGIAQVVTSGETIRAFVRALGPKSSALYDSMSDIPVNTVKVMEARVKAYIDLEIAKEGRKAHKESKKEVHEGKI